MQIHRKIRKERVQIPKCRFRGHTSTDCLQHWEEKLGLTQLRIKLKTSFLRKPKVSYESSNYHERYLNPIWGYVEYLSSRILKHQAKSFMYILKNCIPQTLLSTSDFKNEQTFINFIFFVSGGYSSLQFHCWFGAFNCTEYASCMGLFAIYTIYYL